MNQDIIVSRQCSVGPGDFFGHGAGHGDTTITINFYRPILHEPLESGLHECIYEIRLGPDVVRTSSVVGIDGVGALLRAMNSVVTDLETGCLDEWRISIPKEYLDDMRMVG